ncbi:hypothetical protein ACH5RR_014840 [Cinchona calisaya]|uniref:Uncharacterized protein n=1 Tax=Cinchona calisaya TaxID=153742 RepID=A0ABD2ZRG5_9GENT
MEIPDKTHKFSCDFTSRSRGYHVIGGAGKLSRCRTRMDGGARRRLIRCDGRSGVVDTPPVEWKFGGAVAGGAPVTGGRRIRRVSGDGVVVAVSARKLAAGMWHLAAVLNSGDQSGGDGCDGMTWRLQHGRLDRLQFGLQPPLPIRKSATEGATKWDHACPNAPSPIEICRFHSNVKHLQSRQVATISFASSLQVELVKARSRVKELESERRLFKKKLKHFLRGINEEKASWIKRERKKMFLMIDELKGELAREKRENQKMDIVNSKLLSDLADAKLSVKQFMQNYEKEKNSRELLEDVCHELGKDIEDHKAKIRAMKIECAKIQDEVEEERKMMQMAEVWREERVQMKLVDAKLILEEKYCQINNLVADLETLLRSNGTTPDMIKTSEAEGISLAADSLSIQDIKEQCCTPSMANDIHTITENLQDSGTVERGIDECQTHISAKRSSKFHNVSLESNEIAKNLVCMYSDNSIDCDKSSGNASFRETVTCIKDQYPSYTLGESACPVDGINGSRYISSAIIGNNQNSNQESLNSKTNMISSAQKLKNKGPSLRKLWKSTPSADGVLRAISIEGNGRLSNGSNSSNKAVSREKVSKEAFNQNELLGHWCLPGQRNPHIARAMRGCIEWPRGIQKYGSKANLLEESFENQKTQLQNAFKQRSK